MFLGLGANGIVGFVRALLLASSWAGLFVLRIIFLSMNILCIVCTHRVWAPARAGP